MLYAELIFRLIIASPFWIIMLPIRTIFILLGWVIVPLAVLLRRYEVIATWKGQERYKFKDSWIDKVWGNWEDGIAAGRQYHDTGSVPLQIIYWSCLRNPVNNMRTLRPFAVHVDGRHVDYIGKPFTNPRDYDRKDANGLYPDQWYLVWQKLQYGLYIVRSFGPFGRRRLWLGWKLFPENQNGPTPYQSRGVGFTLQFRRLD